MRLDREFYHRKIPEAATLMLGKFLVRKFADGKVFRDMITEVEAYGGEEDLASHASRGKTARNSVMYEEGGMVYVYLIYGMHWLLNIVTGPKESPQAVLIRSLETVKGPGRVGKKLGLDRSFYGEDLVTSERIWLEEGISGDFEASPRVGVDYAGAWAAKPWRFVKIL